MLKLFEVELTFILSNVVGLFKGEKNHLQMALYSLTLDIFLIKADIFPVAAALKVLRRAPHSKSFAVVRIKMISSNQFGISEPRKMPH